MSEITVEWDEAGENADVFFPHDGSTWRVPLDNVQLLAHHPEVSEKDQEMWRFILSRRPT